MCKTSVVCRTTSHARYNLPFSSRHASKAQKWLRSAQRQTLTLVLNVIVRGKRTSKITSRRKMRHASFTSISNERTKTQYLFPYANEFTGQISHVQEISNVLTYHFVQHANCSGVSETIASLCLMCSKQPSSANVELTRITKNNLSNNKVSTIVQKLFIKRLQI